ncbi:hypothetical protein B0H12DRAFT_114310 [Mycena haematopus]|nr:hypothetical protein B0H12DRAFT_114310 [Mycena haematopus]
MLQYKEFAAWVSIDGTEAPEYGVEISEDQKSATCWISSELGKKFAVHWKNTPYHSDTLGNVFMDGTKCDGIIIRAGTTKTATKDGVYDSQFSKRPFVFSALELTDDDAFLGSSLHQELGLIELKIEPIEVVSSEPATNVALLSEIKVHERSKKAATQQITLAEPELFNTPRLVSICQTTGPELAKFCFKYRPADVLRANGIMPPAPQQLKRKASVEPLRTETSDSDEDEDDAREEKMLRERLNAIEAKRLKKDKKPRIKDESDSTIVDLTQYRKKKKNSESRLTFIQGEIIDLT